MPINLNREQQEEIDRMNINIIEEVKKEIIKKRKTKHEDMGMVFDDICRNCFVRDELNSNNEIEETLAKVRKKIERLQEKTLEDIHNSRLPQKQKLSAGAEVVMFIKEFLVEIKEGK